MRLADIIPAVPPWYDLAACSEVDPTLFHPDRGESPEPAKRFCRTCDALVACRTYSLQNPGLDGVWGAMTTRERGQMRRRARERRERAS